MARAHRSVPKQLADCAPSPAEDGETAEQPHTPRYLTPVIRQYAAQRLLNAARTSPHAPTAAQPSIAHFIDAARAAFERSSAAFLRCTPVPQSASTPTSAVPETRAPHNRRAELRAAVHGYNPSLNQTLVRRVASRLAVADTLRMAAQLTRYLREAAAAAGESASRGAEEGLPVTASQALDLLRRAVDLCRERFTESSVEGRAAADHGSRSPWALTPATRVGAGAATRLHALVAAATAPGQRRRRQLPRCFLRHTSDVQVNEVLPSGAVVSFTHATLPEEVGRRDGPPTGTSVRVDGGAARDGRRRFADPVSFRETLEACVASRPAAVHLHCVLYRSGVSLAAATAAVVDVSEGLVSAQDVRVSTHTDEEDEHVVVQMCSIRVALSAALHARSDSIEDAVQHCLHAARAVVQLNLASTKPKVALQLLACRLEACGGHDNAPSKFQYAVLLRGLEQRGGPAQQIDHAALSCAASVPNFFSPHHFGAAAIPFFRTYHVTEALAQHRYAEAAVMVACLETANDATATAPWLARALQLLCNGEDREGVWQTWWLREVPAELQCRVARAKSELVWNVVASCRLQELATATGGRRDVLHAAAPEPGDFVLESGDAAAAEGPPVGEVSVTPLYTRAQAARFSVHDIVVPVVTDSSSDLAGCASWAEVEEQLGFSHKRPRRPAQQQQQQLRSPLTARASVLMDDTVFRPLLVEASGIPRSARPWCRSFPEPSNTVADLALATDWELARQAAAARDYAAKSRGPRARTWPLSKRGRALTDRLPAGLITVASADGSSLLGVAGAATRHGSRCLALHCTLPAGVSLSNLLSELVTVEDLRDA